MKALYRYCEDFGRSGNLCGVFVEDDAYVEKCAGRKVYWGEVLGKHSDVRGKVTGDTVRKITDDQDFIAKFEAYMLVTGSNPFERLRGQDEDNDGNE